MRLARNSGVGRLLGLAVLLAGLSMLISSQPASGQGLPEGTFSFKALTASEAVRLAVEEHTSKPAASPRESSLFRTLTGPIQIELSLSETPPSTGFLFEESDFIPTNATVTNLDPVSNSGFSEWTLDFTPIRSSAGTVTLHIPARRVSFTTTVGRTRTKVFNTALTENFEYAPGRQPTPYWAGFTSANAYTQDDNNPDHVSSLVEGEHLELAVVFSEKVRVSGGTPYVTIEIGGLERHPDMVSGSGSSVLRFRRTLDARDVRGGGNKILEIKPSINWTSASVRIQEVSGSRHALTTMAPNITRLLEHRPSVAKDGSDPGHMPGDILRWEVEFRADVFLRGESNAKPFLVFTVTKPDGSEEQVQAPYQGRKAGSDKTLIFQYTIPANTVAPDSDFTLYNRHLVIPGGGFEILGTSQTFRRGAVITNLPAPEVLFVADVQVREGESIVYPLPRWDAQSNIELSFVSSGPSTAVSPDTITFGSKTTADVTVTAVQDADDDDEARVQIDGAFWRRSFDVKYVLWDVTVLDDDPAINALTTVSSARVAAGVPVEFQVSTASAPVSGREVTATISQSPAEDGCIEAGALADADSETDGIQIHLPISDTAGGTVSISVPTSIAFSGECTVTATLASPADVSDERFFLIKDSAGAVLSAPLTASATVIGPETPEGEESTTELPDDFGLQLSVDDSDAVVTPGGSFNAVAALTYTGGRYQQLLEASEGRLRLPVAYFWEPSGRHTLSFGAVSADCSFRLVDEVSVWTCPLALAAGAAEVRIPESADPGRFVIVGSVTVDGKTYSDSLEVEVRDRVDEVAEVTFEAAAQTEGEAAGEPYPTSIYSGQSTRLQLRILNENKAASDPDSIAAINFHTSAGSLSASLGSGESAAAVECAAGGLSCQIPVGSLTLSNVGSIFLTVAHPGPGKLGEAQVRAAVVDAEGESFLTEPVAVTFLGGGDTLTISEPRSGVYYQDTADEGADQDDRDLLTLSVSAADAVGSRVEAPDGARRWTIKGPNGRNAAGFSVAWPKGGEDPILDASKNLQVEIDVDSSDPLPVGEYTLELQAGNLRAKQSFSVVSGAGSLSLSGPTAPLEAGETITITAEIKDGSGQPVTDGTSVAWSSGSPSGDGVLIQLDADTATTNGRAAARFFVIGRGSVYVRAESGDATDVLFTSTADAAAADAPAVDYSEFIRGCDPSSWLGEPISASTLYESLEDASTLYHWAAGSWWGTTGWVRYGRHHAPGTDAHGRLIPGSTDFRIPTGGVISIIFTAPAPCPFPAPGR